MLRQCVKPTQKMISSLVQIELAYINTSHPDFIGGKQALALSTKKAAHLSTSLTSSNPIDPTGGGGGGNEQHSSQPPIGATNNAASSAAGTTSPGPSTSPDPRTPLYTSNKESAPAAGFFGLFRPPLTPSGPPVSAVEGGGGGGLGVSCCSYIYAYCPYLHTQYLCACCVYTYTSYTVRAEQSLWQ